MKMTKKILAAIISVLLILAVIPMASFAGEDEQTPPPPTYINTAALTVTAPVEDETISFVATTEEGAKYTATVQWNDEDDYITSETFKFVKSMMYTVTITLTFEGNYVFADTFAATINGQSPSYANVNTEKTVATLKYTFTCAEKQTEEPNPPEEPVEPEEPEEPSFFETAIAKIKNLLSGVFGVLLQALRHIAGF